MSDDIQDPLQNKQLEDLHAVVNRLNIEVAERDLADSEFPAQSGLCRIRGHDVIFIDRTLSPAKQIDVLLNALTRFDLNHIFVADWIRDRLDRMEY